MDIRTNHDELLITDENGQTFRFRINHDELLITDDNGQTFQFRLGNSTWKLRNVEDDDNTIYDLVFESLKTEEGDVWIEFDNDVAIFDGFHSNKPIFRVPGNQGERYYLEMMPVEISDDEEPQIPATISGGRILSILKETNDLLRGVHKRRLTGGHTTGCDRAKLEHDVVVMLNNHGHSVRVKDTSIKSSVALYRNCFYKLDIQNLSPSERDLVVMIEQKIMKCTDVEGVCVKMGANNTKVFMPSNHKDFVGNWEPGATGAAAILSKFDNINYP